MNPTALLLSAVLLATAGTASAQKMRSDDMGQAPMGDAKRIRITYENLTASQVISPSAFISHTASAPALYMVGIPASFFLQRMAEEGNAGPLLSGNVVKTLGGAFGSSVTATVLPPGMTRTVELDVTRDHPMISGFAMLVMTNDGFVGVNNMDAFNMRRPMTMDLFAMDAGTERNTEKGEHMVAMMGSDRAPEKGVVQRHTGLRGNADAPGAWKFDPARPVARITFAPAR